MVNGPAAPAVTDRMTVIALQLSSQGPAKMLRRSEFQRRATFCRGCCRQKAGSDARNRTWFKQRQHKIPGSRDFVPPKFKNRVSAQSARDQSGVSPICPANPVEEVFAINVRTVAINWTLGTGSYYSADCYFVITKRSQRATAKNGGWNDSRR